MMTRKPILESERSSHQNALFMLCLLGLLTPMTLGCLLGGPGGGTGDDGDDGILFGDDEWQDDVDDRRMERDDPSSPLYRGTFELQLEGDHEATMDSTELGESTYTFVDGDLVGTPPHCLITLADRQPDRRGRQGYILLQLFGSDCSPEPGAYELVGEWDGIDASRQAVLKTVQIDVETEIIYNYYTYRSPEGTLDVSNNNGSIVGELDLRMTRVIIDDEEEKGANLSLLGSFDAIAREEN
ncbi:MAG: hypothetical protein VYE40_06860 [Myxococcota bacterium]|jgi:hypothetical protein|nr:hypothetical protein [Myxococcota bacterium]MEC9440800.1 hypothetical protein [Myxococcota bacterium]